ncbi:MAG: protein-glutamate O-methyltransferase CheR [Pseudomonadota bacterium]
MNAPLTHQEFMDLREFIHQRCGIFLGEDKAYLVEHRLARLVDDNQCKSYGELYSKARQSQQHSQLCLSIIDAITTNETFWFREPRAFAALGQRILPALHQEITRGGRADIRMWSAACSTGQEPYSLAMTAYEYFRAHSGEAVCRQHVRILATDISRTVLAVARAGLYDSASVTRGLPAEHLERYFRPHEGRWMIRDTVKELVEFKPHNLREPMAGLGGFDIIALRNVIIYFSEQVKQEIFARLVSALNPGGYFFLGTGETLGQYTRSFELLEYQGLNYYRLLPRA